MEEGYFYGRELSAPPRPGPPRGSVRRIKRVKRHIKTLYVVFASKIDVRRAHKRKYNTELYHFRYMQEIA